MLLPSKCFACLEPCCCAGTDQGSIKTIIILTYGWVREGRSLTLKDSLGIVLALGGATIYGNSLNGKRQILCTRSMLKWNKNDILNAPIPDRCPYIVHFRLSIAGELAVSLHFATFCDLPIGDAHFLLSMIEVYLHRLAQLPNTQHRCNNLPHNPNNGHENPQRTFIRDTPPTNRPSNRHNRNRLTMSHHRTRDRARRIYNEKLTDINQRCETSTHQNHPPSIRGHVFQHGDMVYERNGEHQHHARYRRLVQQQLRGRH